MVHARLLYGQAAMVCQQEDLTGSLDAGKYAHIAVLDRNLFDLPVREIHRARVLLTLVEGEQIFRAKGF